jgi:hypothetical protein
MCSRLFVCVALVLKFGTSLQAETPVEGSVSAPIPGVFDTLKFGDDRATVLAKLKASKVVEMTTDETFIGRSGLNGVFRCRKKIGTLNASLYFDWTEAGKLKEINLQTDLVGEGDYQGVIGPSWKDLIALLGELNGAPVVKGSMPSKSTLGDGAFSPSHLWKLATGGSVRLGVARDGDRFQVVVRFTSKAVQPVGIP